MRRFAENVVFQKFRRHQVNERSEITTNRSNKQGSDEPVEYSKHSTSRDEFNEEHEQYFTTKSVPGENQKKLHYTQSLQDTFAPSPAMADNSYSKEFPPLHREPKIFRHEIKPTTVENDNFSTTIPIMREEQKHEVSEEDRGENFLRRQQQKLYHLREETIRKFGHHNGPHQGHSEQEKRARLHASLPPMGRQQKQFYTQHQIQQQQPFELVLDRCPPQMVQSVPQQTDPTSSTGEKRELRGGSCGFSPFPVFGPFAVNGPMLPRNSSRPSLNVQWDEWQRHQHQQQPSREDNYDNNLATSNQTVKTHKMTSSSMMSSSDEWQSAYEYLPTTLQTPQPHRLSQRSQEKWPPATSHYDQKKQLPEQNIQHTFHIYKFDANPVLSADESVVHFMAHCSARAQFTAPPYLKPWFQQRPTPPSFDNKQQTQPIEMSTVSERQANEEVRTLMRGTNQSSLNTSMTKSFVDCGEGPREVGLPDRIQYHGQPVKVEISGPIHFLHATNMSVTNTNTMTSPPRPTDSVQTSMNSNIGIPLAPESPKQLDSIKTARPKEKSPTKWTQTDQADWQTKTTVEKPPQGQQRAEVISPPVEQYIEGICDLKPILAEIGDNLRKQGQMISPLGNLQKRRYEKETKTEEHIKWREKTTEYNYQVEPGTKMRTSQSDTVLPSSTSNSFVGTKQPRRPSMTGSTVEALSAIWSPYLVESTSHCHLARVTEITQEWRIQQWNKKSTDQREQCACVVTPNYNREFASEKLWTLATLDSAKKYSVPANSERTSISSEFTRKNQQKSQEDHPFWANDKGQGHDQYYRTLQAPNRRRKSQQLEHEIAQQMHKTRSLGEEELPKLIDHKQYETLRRTLDEVQLELDSAQEYTRKSRNAEVERIEQAIMAISERIQQKPQEPVSKAQAEAKEELLRVRLAQMILNLNPDFEPNPQIGQEEGDRMKKKTSSEVSLDQYYGQTLRAPIGLLREKLSLLEHHLREEQLSEIREQLRQINSTPPLRRTKEQKQMHESLNQRNEEIAQMAPLIGMLRHKLSALDELCQKEQRRISITNSGRLTPYEERKTVHDLLVQINNEIDTIHELCHKHDAKDRLDTVLVVLKKVAYSIDRITETLDNINTTTMSISQNLGTTPTSTTPTAGMPSKLEQAVQYRQQIELQQQKTRAQQPGKAEMLGAAAHHNAFPDLEKYIDERRPKDPVPKDAQEELHQQVQSFQFHPVQQKAPSSSVQSAVTAPQMPVKKVPPQVPAKRKSLSSSLDERLGPLYSIVEEKEPPPAPYMEQRVNAVELSALMARPVQSGSRVNAFIPLLTSKENSARVKSPPLSPTTSRNHATKSKTHNNKPTLSKQQSQSQTPPPAPRIVSQQQQRDHPSGGDQEGPIPFRLGPCPISYLERDRQRQQFEQRQRLQQNSIWGNAAGSSAGQFLQPPSRKSSQQQKYFQLQQQHQIL